MVGDMHVGKYLAIDDENAAVGFISYRFLIIDDFQPPTEVCYIYELQVDVSWGTPHASKIISRGNGVLVEWAGSSSTRRK